MFLCFCAHSHTQVFCLSASVVPFLCTCKCACRGRQPLFHLYLLGLSFSQCLYYSKRAHAACLHNHPCIDAHSHTYTGLHTQLACLSMHKRTHSHAHTQHACLSMHTRAYSHAHTHSMLAYPCINAHTHTLAHVHTYTHMHKQVQHVALSLSFNPGPLPCVRTSILSLTHTHTHIHTHTHAHTHSLWRCPFPSFNLWPLHCLICPL